jgi:hypothetical protein
MNEEDLRKSKNLSSDETPKAGLRYIIRLLLEDPNISLKRLMYKSLTKNAQKLYSVLAFSFTLTNSIIISLFVS